MKTQDIKNMGKAMAQVQENMANALANAKAKPKKDVSLAPAPWDKKEVKEDHGEMPSKEHVMKMCKDGSSDAEIKKMHPDCDQDKLQAMIDDCKGSMDEQVSEKMSSKEKMKKGLYNSKMDPVGKADADIDNDGDVDKSDNYLANRRKAIAKNMKTEAKINELSPGKLGRYINKAADDAADFQNSDKRKKGIAKATNKLVKKAGGKPDNGMFNEKETAVEINPNLKDPKKTKKTTSNGDNEMAENTLPPVYARILEKRGEHYKSATKPETQDDMLKGDNAKKMKADATTSTIVDIETQGYGDVSKAGRAGPGPKPRKGDNKAGDKTIINPAKEQK